MLNKLKLVFSELGMVYTNEEKAYLVSWCIAHENAEESRRLFYEKFNKEAPNRNTIHYWKTKLIQTGSFADRPKSGRPSAQTVGENKENVLNLVDTNPCISTRQIAEEAQISQTSVCRILKREKYHPYKPLYCQLLYDGDADRRLQFAQTIQQKMNEDPAFIRKICFSDECVFSLDSSVNKHNVHYWGTENPHVRVEKPGRTPTLTVWACIGFYGVISFDISRETMTGERYVNILQEKVLPHFSTGAGRLRLFQQDGAAPHYAIAARQFLDEHLEGRWVGRRGPIEWPARSPDLTSCDYWLWAYLRQKVYPTPGLLYPSINALGRQIEQQLNDIPMDMFRRSMRDFQVRIQNVIDKDGEHFEM